jgi:hypothetical protein
LGAKCGHGHVFLPTCGKQQASGRGMRHVPSWRAAGLGQLAPALHRRLIRSMSRWQ